MQGINNIKDKILTDARKQAKEILDNANTEAEKIKESTKQNIDSQKVQGNEKIQTQIHLYTHKTLAHARLKSKTDYLNAREEIVKVFLNNLEKELKQQSGYQKYLEKKLKNSPIKAETLICNKADKETFTKLTDVQIKTSDIQGGFILESKDGKIIDESMESLLEQKKAILREIIIGEIEK